MSGFLLEQPLVIQGKQEEAAGIFGNAVPLQFMPSMKNYADDEKTVAYFQNEIAPVMVWTREDRMSLDEEMSTIRNMNLMKHDSGRRYFGRSDSYLPTYRRERQKMVAHLSRGLFPTDDYFDVVNLSGDPESARPVKSYMQWEFETNARVRAYMKPFLGSLVDYGTSVMKYWYKKQIKMEGGVTRKGALGALVQNEYGFKPYSCEGLAISPRNMFFWYIYPSTAQDLNEAMMIFEDIDIPMSFVEWMAKSKRWVNCDPVVESLGDANLIAQHHNNRQLLLNTRSDGMQLPGHGMSASKMGLQTTASEVYTFMPIPDSEYMSFEVKGMPVPVAITCFGNHPVSIRRNPFFHQKAPYLCSRTDWEPGLFYGTAQGRVIRPLQLLSNDFMNQTNDNGILAMNPVSIVDVTKMAGLPPPFKPGATWYTLDINAVKFDRPPIDQVQMGVMLTNMINGMAQDAGGSPPDYSQKSAASKTATGMSIAQRNTTGPMQDNVEDIEIDIMVELLKNGWKNAVQYREEAVMVSVAGEAIQITPDMLAIDAQFKWLASSQAQNSQVRTQQAMQLIQMITPIVPLIMQNGYVVDFVGVIKRVWTDGFGYRNFSDFIRKAAAVPQPGMPQPDQMGGIQQEQGDRLRSALEQVHGQGDPLSEAQPGEAGDFGDVRQQADQMAGMAGSYGGVQ